ncbi:MAG: hypothetical protein EOP83_16875, partial [Verrucomicrobiaceae bacterium]
MSIFKPYRKLYAVLDEGHVLYQGFYQNMGVWIEGRESTLPGVKSQLWVRVYAKGHRVNSYLRPFNTKATARKYAKQIAGELTRAAKTGREQGWPEHSDYDSHMSIYRNWNADHGRAYFDYRRN